MLHSHGSPPRKHNVLHQARLYLALASSCRPTIQVPGIPSTSNQPQYELSNKLFRSSANDPFHPILTVFKLSDEDFFSILSHICPVPQPAGHHAWFHFQREVYGNILQRADLLRPLSMTCRTMWLRLLPWVWECLQLSPPRTWGEGVFAKRLDAIVNIFQANAILAATVKYFYVLCLWFGADSCIPKVCDSSCWV